VTYRRAPDSYFFFAAFPGGYAMTNGSGEFVVINRFRRLAFVAMMWPINVSVRSRT
jgi:hypothetical protein